MFDALGLDRKVEDLLFLTHRIPFPPNKGDKIRSFNLLKHLAKDFRIHLGTFIDDPDDWQYVDAVKEYCVDSCFVGLNPFGAKLRSTRGLITGEALTLPYYRNAQLGCWVDGVLARGSIKKILVFSSALAQYVMHDNAKHTRRVIDFVDIDSDKWRQYSQSLNWPLSWLYQRESKTLLDFERRIANQFDASVFVSEAESDLFKKLAPESAARVTYVENGVDTDYFNPQASLVNPYGESRHVLVFTGAMDYWANADAVIWFASEVFPHIRDSVPDAEFFIVGGRPTESVKTVGQAEGVTVTGAVKDIRPYLAYARLAVAPLRIARGVQNKVLEAMAMGKAVLATSAALDGIASCSNLDALRADDPEIMAQKAIDFLIGDTNDQLGETSRECIESNYNWSANLEHIEQLLNNPSRTNHRE